MSDTPVPSYRIEHLKSADNYPTWSVQIKDILTEAGLFDIVSGTTPRPALQTDNGDNSVAVNSWDGKDRRALANIRTRVSSAMISYVINAITSKQAWDSLKSVFDVQGPVAVILERRRFFRYAIPEGTDIKEHVHALRSAINPTLPRKLHLLTLVPIPGLASLTPPTSPTPSLSSHISQKLPPNPRRNFFLLSNG